MKMKVATAVLLLSTCLAGSSAFVAKPAAPFVSKVGTSGTSLFAEDEDASETFVGAKDISALTKDVKTVFDTEKVNEFLPHRYPFALVDKVIEFEGGKRAVGIKCVSKNEEFFNGHFPDRKVMPGVLQVEALAQLAGIVCLQMEGAEPGALFFFAGVDGVKWKKPVVPGDVLTMEVTINKWNSKFGLAKASGIAYVDGVVAVEVGEMTFALAK